jgi:HNH endonuclease/AP2 domain
LSHQQRKNGKIEQRAGSKLPPVVSILDQTILSSATTDSPSVLAVQASKAPSLESNSSNCENGLFGVIMDFKRLKYDPETGVFVWVVSGHRVTKGSVAGRYTSLGYRQIQYEGKKYLSHRLAWFLFHGEWPKGIIDHINGIKDDNRIANLRDVDQSVNKQNTITAYANNKSGFLGVSFRKKIGRWRAQIVIDKKVKHIGLFDSAEKAHNAYLEAKRKNHTGCTI